MLTPSELEWMRRDTARIYSEAEAERNRGSASPTKK
jgi:hypothetical protein